MEREQTQTQQTDAAQTDFSGASKEQTINDIAWQEFTKADKTPFEATVYDQVRPAFRPTTLTERVARQMMDSAAAFQSIGIDHERDGHLSELVDKYEPAVVRDVKARIAAAKGGKRGH